MSFASDVRAVRDSGLEPLAKLLLIVILTHRNLQRGTFPSVARLAEGTGMAASTVKTCRGKLLGLGILSIDGGRSGGRRSNRYAVHLRNLPAINRPGDGGLMPANRPGAGVSNPPVPGYQPAGTRPAGSREPAATPPPPGHEQQSNKAIEHFNNNSAAAVVVELLGSDALLTKHRPSPEQLAWIAAAAPGKSNPAGWAADAIRRGWRPPNFRPAPSRQKSQGAH